MQKIVDLENHLVRAHCRGILLDALENEIIITALFLGEDGQLKFQTQTWDTHWQGILKTASAKIFGYIDDFHVAWSKYIRSRFSHGLRREYCYRYFALLDELLINAETRDCPDSVKSALKAVLSFECFGIGEIGKVDGISAAGTSTLRNPCYLLAKLIHPNVIDDPQFLPLITLPKEGTSECYYHYRQHKLSTDSDNSILVSLATRLGNRTKSFHLLNRLDALVGEGIDPRADERASRIHKKIILPYLESVISRANSVGEFDFELLDLGSGSGMMAAHICGYVARSVAARGLKPSVRARLIDLSISQPSRFFGAKRFGNAADCIISMGADYRQWLANGFDIPKAAGLRIGLISRFFNNLSLFGIEAVRPEIVTPSKNLQDPSWKSCLPSACLAPDGSGEHSLVAENNSIWLGRRRSFRQLSLSNYFKAIYICTDSCLPDTDQSDIGGVYLPMRSFNCDCLLTSNNDSVLKRMVEICKLVIIQDSDLTPEVLMDHLKSMDAQDISVIDTTRSLNLRRHFSYALASLEDAALKSIEGERIW